MFGRILFFQWLLITMTIITSCVRATHVYIGLNREKCFYEDLSQDMILHGQFLAEYGSKENGYYEDENLKLAITIRETFDKNHKVFSQKNAFNGQFTFTALESGEHAICITPHFVGKSSRGVKEDIRLHIEFHRGQFSAVDGSKKSTISFLKNKIHQMTNKLNNIKSEQIVIKDREARFRDLSEKTNHQIAWWAVVQVLFFCGTCYFQLKYLKNFFVKQKIA